MTFSIVMSCRTNTSSMAGFTSHAIAPSIAATTIASAVPRHSAPTCGRR